MAVRDHIREVTGKAVTDRDLQNYKLKKKKINGEKSETELVLQELDEMVKKDKGEKYVICYRNSDESEEDIFHEEEPKKEIAYIYFQTSAMRKNLEQYPEVLGMDTTYQSNKNGMHLSVMLCVDNHGHGRVVGYCFLHRETTQILQATLKHFLELNPEAASRVRTIIVDKDQKEIAGVHAILPHVKVHLCYTHVIRTFKTNEHLKGDKNKTDIKKLIKSMANSSSKEEFNETYKELKEIASEDFINYFDRQWKDIGEAWVLYVRNETLTLGIRSTNYCESHNSRIKSLTLRSNSLYDCIKCLMLLHRNTEENSAYRDYRELATRAYVANNDDPNVQLIMNMFAQWPAKLLNSEYMQSKADGDVPAGESPDECNCNFFKKFMMGHCQHVFRLRKQKGIPILNMDGVLPRWQKPVYNKKQQSSTSEPDTASPSISIVKINEEKEKHLTQNERLKEVNIICRELASIISTTGGNQFKRNLNYVKKLKKFILLGKEVTISEKTDNTQETKSPCNSPPPTEDGLKCAVCKHPLVRQETEAYGKGRKGRLFIACSNKCNRYFSWVKCPNCSSSNVHKDHVCKKKDPEVDELSNEERHIDPASSPDLEKSPKGSLKSHQISGDHECKKMDPKYNEHSNEQHRYPASSSEGSVKSEHISSCSSTSKESERPNSPLIGPGNFDIGIDEILKARDFGGDNWKDEYIDMSLNDFWKEIDGSQASKIPPKREISDPKRHEKGLQIPNSDVKQISDTSYQVQSQSLKGLWYTVKRKAVGCLTIACARLQHPCMHRYVCECFDSKNPCKHIYKVHSIDAPHEVTAHQPQRKETAKPEQPAQSASPIFGTNVPEEGDITVKPEQPAQSASPKLGSNVPEEGDIAVKPEQPAKSASPIFGTNVPEEGDIAVKPEQPARSASPILGTNIPSDKLKLKEEEDKVSEEIKAKLQEAAAQSVNTSGCRGRRQRHQSQKDGVASENFIASALGNRLKPNNVQAPQAKQLMLERKAAAAAQDEVDRMVLGEENESLGKGSGPRSELFLDKQKGAALNSEAEEDVSDKESVVLGYVSDEEEAPVEPDRSKCCIHCIKLTKASKQSPALFVKALSNFTGLTGASGVQYLEVLPIPDNIPRVELSKGTGVFIRVSDKNHIKSNESGDPSQMARMGLLALFGRENSEREHINAKGSKAGSKGIRKHVRESLLAFVNRNKAKSYQDLVESKLNEVINRKKLSLQRTRKSPGGSSKKKRRDSPLTDQLFLVLRMI
ncbi:hypothetical protein KUF71_019702 [Frankliniella fusca]|uniref:MULE transposase domain-containing protein n=1 Tax=Frankliniella fusca TaxID=407009 RepID=A0AAE1L7U3_9NEOP|nr:hypothetical protein KUF71_019702 [Frankliniella fusca]